MSRIEGKNYNSIIISPNKTRIQQKDTNPVGIYHYFRFAKINDYLFIFIGFLLCLTSGGLSPFFCLLWKDMIDSLTKKQESLSLTLSNLKIYSLIGLATLVASWIMNSCWLITAKRQTIMCKERYFASIISQEIGWFDSSSEKQVSSELMKEILVFEEGMTGTFSNIVYFISLGIANLIFCLIIGWLLTLVILSLIPLLIFSMYMIINMNLKKQKNQEKDYSKAGAVAEQAFSVIKTVKSLNGQKYQLKKYNECLNNKGKKRYSILFGLFFGGVYACLIFIFALGFCFGFNCIYETQHCPASISKQSYTAGTIVSILFSILMAGMYLSRLPIAFRKLVQGRRAAAKIFKIIDRQPKIKSPENGKIIENFKGEIQFHNVSFSYPKEPSKKILNGLNLKIDKLNNALVGHSGCGKSTILQLLLRFYDPDEGEITVDGTNLKELDLVWWRNTIGYVGQQPVLFKGSIKENLSLTNENVSEEEIIESLKKAEVWDFVSQLENTINIQVGEGGTQISGGQKQRIAIARALIKKPKILFLDEATSALDIRTERKIQKTLNKISKDILSITVAHRLDTIKNADEIFSISQGKVVEKGRFQELEIFKNIKYASKQNIQNVDENFAGDFRKNDLVLKQCNKLVDQQQHEQIQKKGLNQTASDDFSFKRLIPYLKGSKLMFCFGIFVTAIFGSIYPIFSVIFSNILLSLMNNQKNVDQVNLKTGILVGIGFLALIVGALQTFIFESIGAKVSNKIRLETFEKLLKLPILWYEQKQNSVGQISSKLGIGCYHMKQFTTVYLYAIFQNIFTFLAAITISLVYQWRTGLVFICLTPLSIGAAAIRVYFDNNNQLSSKNSAKKQLFNPNQVFANIRTVKSLGYEGMFVKIYKKQLDLMKNRSIKLSIASGLFYGISDFLVYFISAFILYIGSIFNVQYEASLLNVLTSVFALNFASQSIGNNSQILPDVTKCKHSISQLFRILDTEDQQTNQISSKSLMIKDKTISQGITFKDICFNHRQRKHLFQNFNLQIPFGKKIGFAGDSGCGKSTLFSLLLRFYEPTSGQILLDGINIKDFDIHYLRSVFGIVFQEPNLFNTSIIQNVKYNLENLDEQKIYQSLSIAEAMNFIKEKQSSNNLQPMESSVRLIATEMNLPTKQEKLAKGLDRNVGPKGSHISGGQKQRLAIARTILRQPTVLLMDEATSNLDGENEEKVQRNLDSFVKDKLFIVIAHRLETIKNSDIIFVFKEGKVIQSGQYEHLTKQNGYFCGLLKGN